MKQEEKELLLKDLCARLPYGIKVCARFNTGCRYTTNVTAICADRDYIQIRQNVLHSYTGSSVEDIRPYLRPMSTMTEEEMIEFERLSFIYDASDGSMLFSEKGLDWLNAHHFDFRRLIEKGLALEAPDGMYKED